MRSLVALCMLPTLALGQYQGPESVEYDPVGDRYLVSNTGSQRIKQRAADGTVTDFTGVLASAPYGLEILGDVVYACMGGGVRGFGLATGEQVSSIALNAGFANGITTDGAHLYVTDFHNSQRRIFKVDPVAGTFSVLASGLPGQPNGIVHVPGTDQLLVAFWGNPAAVRAYHRESGALLGEVTTNVGNIDGINIDCEGRVLIASWSPARISRFTWGSTPVFEDLGVPGLSNPADIDYDAVHQRVCIPNSGNNTVTLFDIACTSTDVNEPAMLPTERRISPNPAREIVAVEPPFRTSEPYLLLNTRGSVIGGGTLGAGAQLDISPLAPGVYTLQFTRNGEWIRFVKE